MSTALVDFIIKALEVFFKEAFEAYKERVKAEGVREFIEEGKRAIDEGYEELDEKQIRDTFNLASQRLMRSKGNKLK